MDAGESWWDVLPFEIKEMIWVFLPTRSLFRCLLVCRAWNRELSVASDRFWSTFYLWTYGPRQLACDPASWKAIVRNTATNEPAAIGDQFLWAINCGHMLLASRLCGTALSKLKERNLEPALRQVALSGDYALALRIIQFQPSAVCSDTLRWAAKGGSLPLVQHLIEKGRCSPGGSHDIATKWYQTRRVWAYDYAVRGGHMHILRYLESFPDGDGGRRNNEGKTTLQHAAKGGHMDIVRMFVEEKRIDIDKDARNPAYFIGCTYCRPPLFLAVAHKHLEVARYLLSRGAQVPKEALLTLLRRPKKDSLHVVDFVAENWGQETDPSERWDAFRSYLRDAAASGDEAMFMRLLQHCGQTFSDESPIDKDLMLSAVNGGSDAIMTKLWALGGRQAAERCLRYAMQNQQKERITWLLDHGADPLGALDQGANQLINSIHSGDPAIPLLIIDRLKQLWELSPERQPAIVAALSRSITVPWGTPGNVTPLMCAVRSGFINVASALLDIGADLEAETRYNGHQATAVCFCFWRISTWNNQWASPPEAMLEFLLQKGANPNPPLRDTDVLSIAAATGTFEYVSILLKHGARTDGHPLHAIFSVRDASKADIKLKIAKLLIQHGAEVAPKRDCSIERCPLAIFCRFINTESAKERKIFRFLMKKGAKVTLHTILDCNERVSNDFLLLLWENFSHQSLPALEGEERKKALGFILIKAAFLASLDLVKELVENHGVDVNFTNERGIVLCASEEDTALMAVLRTSAKNSKLVVAYFLQNGADVAIINGEGETVKDIAWGLFSQASAEVLELLGEPPMEETLLGQEGFSFE